MQDYINIENQREYIEALSYMGVDNTQAIRDLLDMEDDYQIFNQ